MSDSKKGTFKAIVKDGYAPEKKGWQPAKEPVNNGHKPEKAELAPTNPPKRK